MENDKQANKMQHPRRSRFAFQDEDGVDIHILNQGINEINLFLPATIIVHEEKIFAVNFDRLNAITIRGRHGRHIREDIAELEIGDRLIVNNTLLKLVDWENPRGERNLDYDSDNDTVSYSSDSDDVSSWEDGLISENEEENDGY